MAATIRWRSRDSSSLRVVPGSITNRSVCHRSTSVVINCECSRRSASTCSDVQPCGPASAGCRPCGLPG